MRVSIDIVKPIVTELLEAADIDVSDIDLGICCPVGQVCCDRCAYNMRFRNGHPELCLDEDELIQRVLSGEKPVGTIPRSSPSTRLRNELMAAGLVIVQARRNCCGMFCYVFMAKVTTTKCFSDYVNLRILANEFDIVLPNKTILEHVQNKIFLNECDTFVERGIVYGYPLWSSIAKHKLKE